MSIKLEECRNSFRSLSGHALAAHEHALIDQYPEHAYGPGFVQPAFVETDGHAIGRIFEERSTFFAHWSNSEAFRYLNMRTIPR